jgi:hypothetical protein
MSETTRRHKRQKRRTHHIELVYSRTGSYSRLHLLQVTELHHHGQPHRTATAYDGRSNACLCCHTRIRPSELKGRTKKLEYDAILKGLKNATSIQKNTSEEGGAGAAAEETSSDRMCERSACE